MAGVFSSVVCDWIAWGTFLHTVALIGGLVFSCSPSRFWCQCIVVHPILMWRCIFPQWCAWAVAHVNFQHTWLQSRPPQLWTALVSTRVSKDRGTTCSVGSLSCLVSFPEAHWPASLLVVISTCRDWIQYTPIHSYMPCTWVYIRWWFRQGCPWCWCECIQVAWVGSWGKNSRCSWSWTWSFLWRLHYWKELRYQHVCYERCCLAGIVDSVATNDETGSVLFRFLIAYIAKKRAIGEIIPSWDRGVLLSDELYCVGGLFDASADPIGQTSKLICWRSTPMFLVLGVLYQLLVVEHLSCLFIHNCHGLMDFIF